MNPAGGLLMGSDPSLRIARGAHDAHFAALEFSLGGAHASFESSPEFAYIPATVCFFRKWQRPEVAAYSFPLYKNPCFSMRGS